MTFKEWIISAVLGCLFFIVAISTIFGIIALYEAASEDVQGIMYVGLLGFGMALAFFIQYFPFSSPSGVQNDSHPSSPE